MTDPASTARSRAAEEAGYDSMIVPDGIYYPMHSDSVYPFNPDGSRDYLEDKPFIEPFALIPALGAVVRLRFTTFVLKLPVRDPVLTAKQATSVAVLTGGGLVLGVGVSPWRTTRSSGSPGPPRRRIDEEIAILRGLTAGSSGVPRPGLRPAPVKIAPVPPTDPVLIGGHSDAALRRAARGRRLDRRGGDPADLPGLLDKLARFAREEGTQPPGFEIHVISADAYSPEGVARLEEAGVTDLIVGFRWPYVPGPDPEPLETKLTHLRRYADTIITKTQ